MKPIHRNLHIEPGSYDAWPLRLKAAGQPYDITGWRFIFQIRAYDGTLLLDLNTENGGIEVTDASGGELWVHFLATRTAVINEKTGSHELKMIPPSGDLDFAVELYNGAVTFGRKDSA